MPRTHPQQLDDSEVRWVLSRATRAPSVHNTQPWRFGWDGRRFTLTADTARGLTVIDPQSRELVISCGAALQHLLLALRILGRRGVVTVFPEVDDPRVLAAVAVAAGEEPEPGERRLAAAMTRRHTHRGGFDQPAIAASLAVRLQEAAEEEGASLLYVPDQGQRRRVAHLSRVAERALRADARVRDEIAEWTPTPHALRRDGVPASAYASGEPVAGRDEPTPRDFDLGRELGTLDRESMRRDGETGDAPAAGIAVLATTRDLEEDWLRAGRALGRVLLTAADSWVFAAIYSQAVEVANVRDDLRRELCTALWPQLLMQFGYSRRAPTTPRRPVDEVLDDTRRDRLTGRGQRRRSGREAAG
jgi:hypothetical protein